MYFSPPPVLTATALGMIMAVFSLVMLLTEDRGTANLDRFDERLLKNVLTPRYSTLVTYPKTLE